MQNAIGFRSVIEMIVQYQRPIIGHNLLLDLAHTISQFLYPLPNELDEFKSLIHRLFPLIFDTREIISSYLSDVIPHANLRQVYQELSQKQAYTPITIAPTHSNVFSPPSPTPAQKEAELDKKDSEYFGKLVLERKGDNKEAERFHEAGWDAYVAGYVFVKAVPMIAQNRWHLNLQPPAHQVPSEDEEPAEPAEPQEASIPIPSDPEPGWEPWKTEQTTKSPTPSISPEQMEGMDRFWYEFWGESEFANEMGNVIGWFQGFLVDGERVLRLVKT